MSGQYILDERGEPVPEADLRKWGAWMETASRHVGDTRIGVTRVSTVFLGLDHSFGDEPGPVLWETIVFGGPPGLDREQRRYRSAADARAGHEELVALVRRATQ